MGIVGSYEGETTMNPMGRAILMLSVVQFVAMWLSLIIKEEKLGVLFSMAMTTSIIYILGVGGY